MCGSDSGSSGCTEVAWGGYGSRSQQKIHGNRPPPRKKERGLVWHRHHTRKAGRSRPASEACPGECTVQWSKIMEWCNTNNNSVTHRNGQRLCRKYVQ